MTSLTSIFSKIDVNKVTLTSIFGENQCYIILFKLFFRVFGASTLLSLLPFGLATILSLTTLTHCHPMCSAATPSPPHPCSSATSFHLLNTSQQRSPIWFHDLFPCDFLPKLDLSEQHLCFVSENVLSKIDNGVKCY